MVPWPPPSGGLWTLACVASLGSLPAGLCWTESQQTVRSGWEEGSYQTQTVGGVEGRAGSWGGDSHNSRQEVWLQGSRDLPAVKNTLS